MDWYIIKSAFINWFSNIRIYSSGFVLWGDSSYKIKGNHMRGILSTLLPGDVLLRRYDNYLGSVIIKGYWSHAALYIGDNKIIHMLGDGIVEEDILTFLRCDNISVIRYNDSSKISEALIKAKKLLSEDIDYDYDFNIKDGKRHYCTELVDFCFGGPISGKKGFDSIIYPDDFMDSSEFFEVWNKTKG